MPSPSTIASFNGASASSLPPCSGRTQTTELVMAAERARDQALAGRQHTEERLRGLGSEAPSRKLTTATMKVASWTRTSWALRAASQRKTPCPRRRRGRANSDCGCRRRETGSSAAPQLRRLHNHRRRWRLDNGEQAEGPPSSDHGTEKHHCDSNSWVRCQWSSARPSGQPSCCQST